MTQTNTPKPAPRSAGAAGAEDPVREETGAASTETAAVRHDEAPQSASSQDTPPRDTAPAAPPSVPPSGDISVVTVSDAQDRTSVGSLSAVNTMSQPAAAAAAMPLVTAGPGNLAPSGAAAGPGTQPGTESEAHSGAVRPDPNQPDLNDPDPNHPDAGQHQAGAEDTGEAPGEAPDHISERRERAEGPEPAAALTADRLLNKAAAAPVAGWRRWLYQATLGFVNLGDPDRVRIQRAMEHRIATRLGERTRYVPVLSRKGGVGKTTVTTLLGMVLADLREDRVIAMDANPDRGTLSDRSPGRADFTARQLVKDRFTVNSFAQLSNYTARDGSRLDVLASDTDPMVAHAFDDADYRAVTDILGRYYSIVLTDSGTGMVHSVMKGTLEKADAVVLVSGGSVDEARLASETLSWLEAHGRQDLVARATVVINMAAGDRTLVNIDEIEQHFLSRVKNVVRIPHDRHLAEGSRIQLSQLKPATRSAAVELASLVMEELQQA
ncbi:ESX-1 secretion-associated protein EspI [Arthrobacter sp. Bi83]|uniref:MinD/ParA family ATP-binding protein n=1 Tax=Arthrobacter sp. Bi83 TaxID=2822353 RepID=UPI001D2C06BF|nr:MinD/ParA family protein [Arthrobacter sp. Bi83]CAH0174033.1 ESX-1 secretion-associated protein EspI [Arthrobacter sp. Bi83]